MKLKHSLIVFLLFAINFTTIAQKRSSFEFSTSADISFRTLKSDSPDNIQQFILEGRQEREKATFNWRVGLLANRKLSNTIYLKSGIRLASIGYLLNSNTDLQFPNEHDGNGGHVVIIPENERPSYIKQSEDFWFIELPLLARYEFSNEKFAPFVELGFSSNMYITSRSVTKTDKNKSVTFFQYDEDSSSQINTIQLAGIFSFGLNYNLKNNIQLVTQPTFRYHFTEVFDAPISENLYSFGIEFGVRKKI